MNIDILTCPACGSPIKEDLTPNEPYTCSACSSRLMLTDWTEDGRIVCHACGAVNDQMCRFCSECNATLQTGCPFCYTLNQLDATHCRLCGASLQRAWQLQKSWLVQKRAHDEERRTVLRDAQEQSLKAEIQRFLLQLDEPENHPIAIFSLQRYGSNAVPELVKLLKDDDVDARYGAAHTLGLIGDPAAVPGLIAALDDKETAVRFWIVDALGKFKKDDRVVDPLARRLKDRSKYVRDRAANALKQVDTPAALKALHDRNKIRWW